MSWLEVGGDRLADSVQPLHRHVRPDVDVRELHDAQRPPPGDATTAEGKWGGGAYECVTRCHGVMHALMSLGNLAQCSNLLHGDATIGHSEE